MRVMVGGRSNIGSKCLLGVQNFYVDQQQHLKRNTETYYNAIFLLGHPFIIPYNGYWSFILYSYIESA